MSRAPCFLVSNYISCRCLLSGTIHSRGSFHESFVTCHGGRNKIKQALFMAKQGVSAMNSGYLEAILISLFVASCYLMITPI